MNTFGKIVVGTLTLAGLVVGLLVAILQLEKETLKITPTLEYILLTATPWPTSESSDMSVPQPSISSIKIDEVALEPVQSGMWIHMKLTSHNLRGDKFQAGVIFLQSDTNEPVKSRNDSYRWNGQLAKWTDKEPIPDDEVIFPDVKVFIPYVAFDLPKGRHRLGYQAQIYYFTPQSHGPTKSNLYNFTLTFNEDNAVDVISAPTLSPHIILHPLSGTHSSTIVPRVILNTDSQTPTP